MGYISVLAAARHDPPSAAIRGLSARRPRNGGFETGHLACASRLAAARSTKNRQERLQFITYVFNIYYDE